MGISDIFSKGLDFNEAFDLLRPAFVYALLMAVYAIFVFKFYRSLAARDMFSVDFSKYEEVNRRWLRSALHMAFYVLKYLVLFPVAAFFWFAVLTLILAFLSRGQDFQETLLVAFATVGAIRITAYYKEALSQDVAKILPFAVLAAFIIDISFFSVDESLESLKNAKDYSEDILYYLFFLAILEFALRLLMGVIKRAGRSLRA